MSCCQLLYADSQLTFQISGTTPMEVAIFFKQKKQKAMTAMKRAIRDEQLKGISLVVAIMSLVAAIIALLVGFAGVVYG